MAASIIIFFSPPKYLRTKNCISEVNRPMKVGVATINGEYQFLAIERRGVGPFYLLCHCSIFYEAASSYFDSVPFDF